MASPYPTVKAINVPEGRFATRRDIILGAAQTALDSKEDLTALDEFLKTRVSDWDKPKLARSKRSMGRPGSQGSARMTVPPIASPVSRPHTVASGSFRASAANRTRQSSKHQMRFTHFEL